MKQMMAFVLIVVVLSGCAGKVTYRPPSGNFDIKNSMIVELPKDEVWKRIIPIIGTSFFTVNNLDKESGFINVSYSGNPERYVDCGYLESYVMNLRGERTYRFPAAKAFQQYETLERGTYLFRINRKMDLEGRINIVVQEIDKKRCLVSVNTKYLLTKSGSWTNPQGFSKTFSDTISFNTKGNNSFPNPRSKPTTCYCTGVLEKELLSLFLFENSLSLTRN